MHAEDLAHNQRESNANTQAPQAAEPGLPRSLERFRLLKRIARGGMGEVFLATVVGIEGAERPVVIKTVRRDHDTDSSFLARFLDEARIQSQLRHPGVAQILEAATDSNGKPYVAVEYVEGKNLSDLRGRAAQLGVRIGWPEALAIAINIGDALAHVHERKDADGKPLEIVHRDLSPQNVMVGYGGDIKLIDFGTARGENRRCHTISGVVFAKPGYVAPEVANNTPGGVPADLYAFGVIVWELVSGRRFLVGEPAAHLAAVGAGKKDLPPIAQSASAPAELDGVIQKLTARSIDERMASAREATAELVKILKRAPSLADGDRSVRGRLAGLMGRLYPAEPARSRAEFQRLVRPAREKKAEPPPLPQSPPPPDSGVVVLPGTRYRIERELGRGAMGIVYEGFHLDLGRRVALKVLHGECGGDQTKAGFVAEARAVARITHESLVRLHEFGFTSDGRAFYAMELVEGETLEKKLAREGLLSVREAVGLGIGACRAVEAAHAAGLVHRDIKPGNLIRTSDGTVKLLDFGVAKPQSEVTLSDESERGALVIVGTPEYMAPEQARGSADERSDVYALGAVLYELVTGALPHEAPSIPALYDRKLAGPPERASEMAPGQKIPRAFDRLIERALAPEPSLRFQSAADLREALEAIAGEKSGRRTLRRAIGYAVVGATTFAATAILGASLSGGTAGWAGHQRALSGRLQTLFSSNQATPRVPAKPVASPPVVSEAPKPSEAAATADAAPAEAPSPPAASEPEAAPDTAPEAPKNEPAVKALAEFDSLTKNGRALKALHAIRKAASEFPNEPAILRAHARAAQESKAWGEARRAAARWVEVDPSTEARLSLARLERATGNTQRALALLGELAKEDPKSEEVRRLIALLPTDQKLALNR
jgi:eukaryotic-like serine/threonine-protein kinase